MSVRDVAKPTCTTPNLTWHFFQCSYDTKHVKKKYCGRINCEGIAKTLDQRMSSKQHTVNLTLSSSMVSFSHMFTRTNLVVNQHLIKATNTTNENSNMVASSTTPKNSAPRSNYRVRPVVGEAVDSETATKKTLLK